MSTYFGRQASSTTRKVTAIRDLNTATGGCLTRANIALNRILSFVTLRGIHEGKSASYLISPVLCSSISRNASASFRPDLAGGGAAYRVRVPTRTSSETILNITEARTLVLDTKCVSVVERPATFSPCMHPHPQVVVRRGLGCDTTCKVGALMILNAYGPYLALTQRTHIIAPLEALYSPHQALLQLLAPRHVEEPE